VPDGEPLRRSRRSPRCGATGALQVWRRSIDGHAWQRNLARRSRGREWYRSCSGRGASAAQEQCHQHQCRVDPPHVDNPVEKSWHAASMAPILSLVTGTNARPRRSSISKCRKWNCGFRRRTCDARKLVDQNETWQVGRLGCEVEALTGSGHRAFPLPAHEWSPTQAAFTNHR
jgi:hypothetical protein